LADFRTVSSVDLEDIREVVVVASSSRGGSSMFMEMLRHSEGLLHLQAEINPFLVLAERAWPHNGTGSDRLGPEHLTSDAREILSAELGREIGRRARGVLDRDRLSRDLGWRLSVQWPRLTFTQAQVRVWVDAVLAEMAWDGRSEGLDLEWLHLSLIRHIREVYPQVDPWFYDIEPQQVAEAFPDLSEPQGPPGAALVEESPFILASPWQGATPQELAEKPLVIKSPSNAYRLEFLRSLFPRARTRILHLVRNPAASINGLVDGWQFRGFHAHRLEEALNIEGYTDVRPADSHWWKYDLAPGWDRLRSRPLTDVCAHQWASAHEAILSFLDRTDCESFQLRFEDIVGLEESRVAHFRRLFEWLGVAMDPWILKTVHDGIPPVMATSRPRHRRWYERADLLGPVIAQPRIQAVAERLGYGEPETWT